MLNILFFTPIQFSAIFRFEAHFLWAQFKKFTVIMLFFAPSISPNYMYGVSSSAECNGIEHKTVIHSAYCLPILVISFFLKFACRLHDYENK